VGGLVKRKGGGDGELRKEGRDRDGSSYGRGLHSGRFC